MDFSDPHQRAVFFDVHCDLPREGPGDEASLRRALSFVGDLPAKPRILDIACGPGGQTLDLAQAVPDAEITAFDLHPAFIAQLDARAQELGVADRIHTHVADMTAIPSDFGRFDLIWCEGAAYNMGVPEALRAWPQLLNPGGKIAFSEAVWLRDDAPGELRKFWNDEYPAMQTVDGCRAWVMDAGYTVLGEFVLPDEAWWTHYYTPMEQRVGMLSEKYKDDAVALSVVQECADEITFHRQYGSYYGYTFIVAKRAG